MEKTMVVKVICGLSIFKIFSTSMSVIVHMVHAHNTHATDDCYIIYIGKIEGQYLQLLQPIT